MLTKILGQMLTGVAPLSGHKHVQAFRGAQWDHAGDSPLDPLLDKGLFIGPLLLWWPLPALHYSHAPLTVFFAAKHREREKKEASLCFRIPSR